jgi:hypothetical protein
MKEEGREREEEKASNGISNIHIHTHTHTYTHMCGKMKEEVASMRTVRS